MNLSFMKEQKDGDDTEIGVSKGQTAVLSVFCTRRHARINWVPQRPLGGAGVQGQRDGAGVETRRLMLVQTEPGAQNFQRKNRVILTAKAPIASIFDCWGAFDFIGFSRILR